jgi:pilus assembly protein CpaF
MFGKRSTLTDAAPARPAPAAAPQFRGVSPAGKPVAPAIIEPQPQPQVLSEAPRTEDYYVQKSMIFGALIEAIDLSQLARLDADSAREEIRDIVNEIIAIKNIVMSISEQEDLLDDICNDVLGYGPLEPLLARDEIADIMVNAPSSKWAAKSS